MSETQTSNHETQIDLNPEPISEETLNKIVSDIVQNPEKYPTEARLILKIRREGRRGGCGYVYLYKNDYEILKGEVQEVVLSYGEQDCNWFEDVAIIPQTVPVVVMEKYHDEDPQVHDYITIHVFGVDGWKSVSVAIS
jgi:hypothetical protein